MTLEPVNAAGKTDHDEESVRYTVLSHRAIALWAVLIVAAGVGLAVWLLLTYGDGDDPRVRLDAIRTAGTLVVGAGGAAALLLAARRQRTAEIALKQKDRDQADVARAHVLQERVAATTEHDAAARRITELYTAAAAQLGSDKAPVRLAGLYALERLAQDNANQRQTIVNVLCAYLRMPYTLPVDPSDDPDIVAQHREQVQEREVRLTAQRVLAAHLRPGDPADTFWADTDLDLTGAILINFELPNCRLRSARFTHAEFVGSAQFDGTEFTGGAHFIRARFARSAQFMRARFAGDARFGGARFTGSARFGGAKFTGGAQFVDAEFARSARFDGAEFARSTSFDDAKFLDGAQFGGAKFTGSALFDRAKFTGGAQFVGAEFSNATSFQSAVFPRVVPPEVRRFRSPPPPGKEVEPEHRESAN